MTTIDYAIQKLKEKRDLCGWLVTAASWSSLRDKLYDLYVKNNHRPEVLKLGLDGFVDKVTGMRSPSRFSGDKGTYSSANIIKNINKIKEVLDTIPDETTGKVPSKEKEEKKREEEVKNLLQLVDKDKLKSAMEKEWKGVNFDDLGTQTQIQILKKLIKDNKDFTSASFSRIKETGISSSLLEGLKPSGVIKLLEKIEGYRLEDEVKGMKTIEEIDSKLEKLRKPYHGRHPKRTTVRSLIWYLREGRLVLSPILEKIREGLSGEALDSSKIEDMEKVVKEIEKKQPKDPQVSSLMDDMEGVKSIFDKLKELDEKGKVDEQEDPEAGNDVGKTIEECLKSVEDKIDTDLVKEELEKKNIDLLSKKKKDVETLLGIITSSLDDPDQVEKVTSIIEGKTVKDDVKRQLHSVIRMFVYFDVIMITKWLSNNIEKIGGMDNEKTSLVSALNKMLKRYRDLCAESSAFFNNKKLEKIKPLFGKEASISIGGKGAQQQVLRLKRVLMKMDTISKINEISSGASRELKKYRSYVAEFEATIRAFVKSEIKREDDGKGDEEAVNSLKSIFEPLSQKQGVLGYLSDGNIRTNLKTVNDVLSQVAKSILDQRKDIEHDKEEYADAYAERKKPEKPMSSDEKITHQNREKGKIDRATKIRTTRETAESFAGDDSAKETAELAANPRFASIGLPQEKEDC